MDPSPVGLNAVQSRSADMSRTSRLATHAGSWYTEKSNELRNQLDGWLQLVGDATHTPARAIIAPHAGYRYSGSTAAFAFKQIDPDRVRKIFILGPSHHVYLDGCALSPATTYKTPLMDLTIDKEIYDELYKTGLFEEMSLGTDEDEHSIEMQLPYIAKVNLDSLLYYRLVTPLPGVEFLIVSWSLPLQIPSLNAYS